ncbi:hypothetical protein [Nostoc sp. PA-18-2419]|uniref:hypothetical protein n=1 Tax=Nostoc sp. PA-18-2419 TaxID=2575443 RepID=UPI0011098BD7|nr:hypothetical protein [Nostoc sp. PA-18-2419]
MTNTDPAQSIRPLVEFIKIEIPSICDQHAELVANQLVAGLPHLFAIRPEIFPYALSAAGQSQPRLINDQRANLPKLS